MTIQDPVDGDGAAPGGDSVTEIYILHVQSLPTDSPSSPN
jgi:hypothetical protein